MDAELDGTSSDARKEHPFPAHRARELTRTERKLRRAFAESDFAFDAQIAYGPIDHLQPLGGSPQLGTYIKQLWQRRHFIWLESRNKVSSTAMGNTLGLAWLIFKPLLDVAFYLILFGLILKTSRGVDNYIAFVTIGIFMFQSTKNAITSSIGSIRASKSMIRAFNFPRASIPIALVIRNFIERIPAYVAMFALIALIPPHETPELSWLLFPIILALHMIFDFGITLILARCGAAFPDLSYFTGFAMRFLLYGSGVIFPISRFVSNPDILAIVESNPVFIVLDMYRAALMENRVPEMSQWAQFGAWSLGLFVIGFIWFWRGEESYARERHN